MPSVTFQQRQTAQDNRKTHVFSDGDTCTSSEPAEKLSAAGHDSMSYRDAEVLSRGIKNHSTPSPILEDASIENSVVKWFVSD